MELMEIARIIDWSLLLDQWAIAMLAGSIALLLATRSSRPKNPWLRGSFLLFVPAWWLLFGSLIWGTNNQRMYRYYLLNGKHQDYLKSFLEENGRNQEWYFQYAILVLALWLLLLLLFWVFSRAELTDSSIRPQ